MTISMTASAQSDLGDLRKKDQKAFSEAKENVRLGRYSDAGMILTKILTRYPKFYEGIVLQSEAKYRSGELKEATILLKRAIELSEEKNPRDFFSLARIYHELMEIKSAIKSYRVFLESDTRNQRMRTRAEKAIESLTFLRKSMVDPVDFTPVKLGDGINTEPYSEYWPSFSADGQTMIFTRGANGQEDFFISQKSETGGWLPAEPMQSLNTPQNEGAQSISGDGSFMVFTGCNRRDGVGSCDLYYSKLIENTWTKPQNFGIGINTPGWDGQPTLTADGKGLYFVSNRAGGLGKKDIWYTKQNKKGQWLVPVNLGEPVNTSEDDHAPHLHFDGVHLYFMSSGHLGFGDGDIFVSRNELGKWQKPKNLGYPINTIQEEGALSVSPDGKYAYFARGEKASVRITAYQNHDIYRFKLPAHLRPQPVVFTDIQVIDKQSGELIPASIEIFIPGENEARSSFSFEPEEKVQRIILNANQKYGIHISSSNYVFYSDQIEIQSDSLKQAQTITIALEPLLVADEEKLEKEPIILHNIFFETGSATLDQRSDFELIRMVKLLEEAPDIKIEIRGHTDNIGEDEFNQRLSTDRAKAVYDYLVDSGIQANRLSFNGFGEQHPIASNETDEGRQQNRRTEFLILE